MAPPNIHERVDAARRHLIRAVEWKGPVLGVLETRRHYTNYFRGMPGVKEYRKKLVTLMELPDLLAVLEEIEARYADYVFS